jgi:hypothetical protein
MSEQDYIDAVTGDGTEAQQALSPPLPVRRYLSRDEASDWLGVSVDTFNRFGIPYVDFGPRCMRWDVVDIIAYAEQNKSCDSARTSATNKTQRRRQTCVSTNAKAHNAGGPIGTTNKANATAKALGLKI